MRRSGQGPVALVEKNRGYESKKPTLRACLFQCIIARNQCSRLTNRTLSQASANILEPPMGSESTADALLGEARARDGSASICGTTHETVQKRKEVASMECTQRNERRPAGVLHTLHNKPTQNTTFLAANVSCLLSRLATALGPNLTHVPVRNEVATLLGNYFFSRQILT